MTQVKETDQRRGGRIYFPLLKEDGKPGELPRVFIWSEQGFNKTNSSDSYFWFFTNERSPNKLLSSVLTACNCFSNCSWWLPVKSIHNITKDSIWYAWPHEADIRLRPFDSLSSVSYTERSAVWSTVAIKFNRCEETFPDITAGDVYFY